MIKLRMTKLVERAVRLFEDFGQTLFTLVGSDFRLSKSQNRDRGSVFGKNEALSEPWRRLAASVKKAVLWPSDGPAGGVRGRRLGRSLVPPNRDKSGTNHALHDSTKTRCLSALLYLLPVFSLASCSAPFRGANHCTTGLPVIPHLTAKEKMANAWTMRSPYHPDWLQTAFTAN